MINGIDVSGWDDASPDYAGLDFVIIKATEGVAYVNPHMATQTAEARKLGLAVHFYMFLDSNKDPKAQVEWFTAKALSVPGDGLWIDWEEDPDTKMWATSAQKDAALAELKALRGGNHRCGLYTNVDGWLHHDSSNNCGDGLWIADVSVPAGKPPIEHAWTVHQYAQSPDKDVADFATKADMLKWMGVAATAPAPVVAEGPPTKPVLVGVSTTPPVEPEPEAPPPVDTVSAVEEATVFVHPDPPAAPAPTVLKTYTVNVMSDGTIMMEPGEVVAGEAPVPPTD